MSEVEQKHEVARQFTRYIFLDVVGFSDNRSAEAQSDIINELNRIVLSSLSAIGVEPQKRILLPTGDGMCIALQDLRFDLHIRIALDILEHLFTYNDSTEDHMRKFTVRIGINQNTDIVFEDINKNVNLAGAGINLASRVMDIADGNQIIVSAAVFEELHASEKYMGKFREHHTVVKHQRQLFIYQFVGDGYSGLNVTVPSKFAPRIQPELTTFAAYYLAHAIAMRQQILAAMNTSVRTITASAIVVTLYFMAIDSINSSKATETEPYEPKSQNKSFAERVQSYIELSVVDLSLEFCKSLYYDEFAEYKSCFETVGLYAAVWVTDKGVEKLKSEWPNIYKDVCNPLPNMSC